MKTLQQIEKEIEALQVEREELINGRLAPIPFPENGKAHWYLRGDGISMNSTWRKVIKGDISLHKRGQVTPNKRDIEKVIKLQEQWGQFTLKAIQIADGWEPDWGDEEQLKYYAYYGQWVDGTKNFELSRTYSCQWSFIVYLPTTEAAKHLRDWANANVEMEQ